MPVTVHRDVQSDDDRQFITFKVGSNGHVAYRKIYLRTTDPAVARRRARAVDDLEDPAEARRIIALLASSPSPEEEQRRIKQLAVPQAQIPSLTMARARKELETILCPRLPCEPLEVSDQAVTRWREAGTTKDQRDLLLEFGVTQNELDKDPDLLTDLAGRDMNPNPDFKPAHRAWEITYRRPEDSLKPDRPARGPRLSACIEQFKTEQQQRNNRSQHINFYVAQFQTFVDLVKDKPMRALQKADFVAYTDHVLSENASKSNKTIRDKLTPIRAVFEAAQARMEDSAFPDGLAGWLKVLDREKRCRPYKSPLSNRQPIPPAVFKALLNQAEQWASMDWKAFGESLPIVKTADRRRVALSRNINLRKAFYLRRIGTMTHSMLCLAANVGAQPVDFARLTWDELLLEGDLPLFREERTKPAHLLGSEIPRCCPLVAETVRSLRRWKAWRLRDIETNPEKGKTSANFVFTQSNHLPLEQETCYTATKSLWRVRKAAQCTQWEMRHCRNIGASLQRDAHLPEGMAHAWLGHSAGGTNKFYTGEARDNYLLPLVTLINAQYFAHS